MNICVSDLCGKTDSSFCRVNNKHDTQRLKTSELWPQSDIFRYTYLFINLDIPQTENCKILQYFKFFYLSI